MMAVSYSLLPSFSVSMGVVWRGVCVLVSCSRSLKFSVQFSGDSMGGGWMLS